MTLSFTYRLRVLIIQFFVDVIWYLDLLGSITLDTSLQILKLFALSTISFSFVVFIIYSYFTGYLYRVADGVFYSVNPALNESKNLNPSVLGIQADVFLKGPIRVDKLDTPAVSAKSALIVDKGSSKILYELNSSAKFAPASTTKLMTALVALGLYKMDEVLKVSQDCASIDSTKVWLPVGSEFKVKDLMFSLLIASAGDSACVLSIGKVSYDDFVSLMNAKAKEFGMKDTFFTNPIGLDSVDGGHSSNVKDLYKLSVVAMQNPTIQDIVKTKSYALSSVDSGFKVNVSNTNKLLWNVPETIGVKTGTTKGAGEVLIYEYKKDVKDLVIIVMGSHDRFSDTKALLDWTLASYSWD